MVESSDRVMNCWDKLLNKELSYLVFLNQDLRGNPQAFVELSYHVYR